MTGWKFMTNKIPSVGVESSLSLFPLESGGQREEEDKKLEEELQKFEIWKLVRE